MEESYADIAREYDDMKAKRKAEADLVPVPARVSKAPRAVFSLRLAPSELSEISVAAQRRGENVSDFMRKAALAAARGGLDMSLADQLEALDTLYGQVGQVKEGLERLRERSREEEGRRSAGRAGR